MTEDATETRFAACLAFIKKRFNCYGMNHFQKMCKTNKVKPVHFVEESEED